MKSPATTRKTVNPSQRHEAHPARRGAAWKSTDAATAARDFFARPRRTVVRDLVRELCSDDPFHHRCAGELARLVSRREPGILAAYSGLLAEVAATFPMEEWQARGYVLASAAMNATTRAQRMRLLPLVRARLAEDRVAVRAMALETFAFLAALEPDLRDEALERLENAGRSSEPGMRARARLMFPTLLKVLELPPKMLEIDPQ